MEQLTDKMETMILMALDANHKHTVRVESSPRRGYKSNGTAEVLEDQGTLLKFGDMHPASAFTFDATDRDRIFAATPDLLVEHPADIIGEQSETIMIDQRGFLKWCGLRRIKTAPRGVSCIGVPSHWYEMHIRLVTINGTGEYFKRVVPIGIRGTPLPAKVQGHWVCSPEKEGIGLILCASLIEDAYRANTMLAEVKDATEIKFPVPIDDYKNVFAKREGPLNGSRRKAIVHWVASHFRNSTRGNEYEVKRYTRGVQEFSIDGIRIRITPND